MEVDIFRNLPVQEIAHLVRTSGSKVCVFPAKGTRRWFMLEHPSVSKEDYASAYLNAVFERHIALYKMLFDHGLDTLMTPSFDLPLMERGEAYMQMAAEGLAALIRHPAFLEFYKAYGVRVRFYGDYRKFLATTPYAYLLDLFDELVELTCENDQHRLFWGLFVHDATETVVNLSIQYYREHECFPDKQTLIEQYYGESIGPVHLFIGFSKLRAFDMPLLATSQTDLYFMVSPSLYLTEQQLRDILYDHLYSRLKSSQSDYGALKPDEQALMKDFYKMNIGNTLGIGKWHNRWEFWHPLPQVQLPSELTSTPTE